MMNHHLLGMASWETNGRLFALSYSREVYQGRKERERERERENRIIYYLKFIFFKYQKIFQNFFAFNIEYEIYAY